MNILGHEFEFLERNYSDTANEYICKKCNCYAAQYDLEYSGFLYMWVSFGYMKCHHYASLVSCDELIIKNIVE